MPIDWAADPDDPGRQPDNPEKPVRGDGPPDPPLSPADPAPRTERSLSHRAIIDAAYQRYAIDQGCARVEKIERERVTPAMRRIESQDPERTLTGLEHRLKGRERIEEKVRFDMRTWGVTAGQAFSNIKDAIRYTFQYPGDRYTDGVTADCERLENEGFELVERRNSWEGDQYKGINSRWRVPEKSQLFEVQFHTRASFEAKQETHAAYERLRTLPEDHEDVHKLQAFQREVTAQVPVPPGALEIPNYP